MAVFKCKMCGGTLEVGNESVVVCEYCGIKQTLPRLSDERKANLYDRANHFRRNNEFDKAMGIYEQILNEDSTDAETYWSLVLCRYGVEYVEDPSSRKRVPTINRAQFTSVFDDADYKSALEYADAHQREVYEQEAEAINEIQKGFLAISQKEEPFDVFICYKETDKEGRRTHDSVLATELYHELVRVGYKVFFSRITLEDKLGTAYEPYIFAALNSAKVMVVLGTKPEYFNAVWVKNEWSRFLALIRNGARKALIPAYKGMDPYDLPDEFSHLQAQDMSRLGFMQDLVYGIQKLVTERKVEPQKAEPVQVAAVGSVGPLLKRAYIFLEDGEWASAEEYAEKVLDLDPECAEAYLCKLMAELHVKKRENLFELSNTFDELNNYQKAYRYGNQELKGFLSGCCEQIVTAQKECAYSYAMELKTNAVLPQDFFAAAYAFDNIPEYKDAAKQADECREEAVEKQNSYAYSAASATAAMGIKEQDVTLLESAYKDFSKLSDYKDSSQRAEDCRRKLNEIKQRKEEERLEAAKKEEERKQKEKEERAKRNAKIKKISIIAAAAILVVAMIVVVINLLIYNSATSLEKEGKYYKAAQAYHALGSFWGAEEKYEEMMSKATIRQSVCQYGDVIVAVKWDGDVLTSEALPSVYNWRNIVSISGGESHIVGLRADGSVVAVGFAGNGQCSVRSWTQIVSIGAGKDHTAGAVFNGTVVATGSNDYGQCNVSDWKDIIAVSCGENYTVGLRYDGTVVATGDNQYGQCDVGEWTDIVKIYAGATHTLGLKSDGTVVATGKNNSGQCDLGEWKDIVAIAAGGDFSIGVLSDGTVVAKGYGDKRQCNVSDWINIVAVDANADLVLALDENGRIKTTRNDINTQKWPSVVVPEN